MAVRILAADDSATMRKVIELTFAGEAVDVETVDSGEAALERAASSPPDLVIADASMSMSGYDVARADVKTFAVGCFILPSASPQWVDTDDPSTGEGFYYLVRAASPFIGSWGANSDEVERSVCP